jgi:hypothetical protein
VFEALALAAGLKVRTWAFSFEGFGGKGHIFNEVWDAAAGGWLMLDVFNNVYFVDAQGRPMSGLALRDALQAGAQPPRMVPIQPSVRPNFRTDDAAQAYFRRGLGEWYMWWGNAVYTYDRALLVRALGPVSRSLEQLGAIAQGVHPRIRILDAPENRPKVRTMWWLRLHLLAALAASVCAVAVALGLLLAQARARVAPGARALHAAD